MPDKKKLDPYKCGTWYDLYDFPVENLSIVQIWINKSGEEGKGVWVPRALYKHGRWYYVEGLTTRPIEDYRWVMAWSPLPASPERAGLMTSGGQV